MHSLRTRLTLLTVCVIAFAVIAVTLLSVVFIRRNERRESEQLLLLLCETGERNLDYYFNSVQKSVEKVAAYAEEDLDGLETAQLARHIDRVGAFFDETANKTNGVLTYYYRIDPAISDSVKGFWYTDLNGDGFVEHEVTDITLYDTQDTSRLVWFTVPKHSGKPIWLPPYITDNLNMRVISYNVPIYWRGQFVGVIGIEIDYSTMAKQVESIRLYSNGYAFLSDSDGELFFHPRIDVTERLPDVPDGALSKSTFLHYRFDGEDKVAAWLPLSNGMRLVVTVPVSETEGEWQRLITEILIVSMAVLVTMSVFTMFYAKRITKPLEKLTEAAQQVDRGDYDVTLDYQANDEIGKLTKTFGQLVDHVKEHISDLHQRMYVDALTSVKNKGAFSTAVEELQTRADRADPQLEFAIGVFDCDNLKTINDRYGHEKGDIYLKTACRLICRIFQHSPVYRIGGDEFAVILQNEDFRNRDELVRRFDACAEEICASAENSWEEIHIAMGIAVFDPKTDQNVTDAVRRADRIMYANKRERKEAGR